MTTIEDRKAILKAREISKSFPGVQALDRVNFEIYESRLNGLVGENGAGKSTLMNILAGVFPPDSGEIIFKGNRISLDSPKEAQARGISIIHQELNLLPNLSVAENIFLGREPLTRLGLIHYDQMKKDVQTLLNRLQCNVNPGDQVSDLRIGQQQIVEIAKAISFDSKIIIMDEPTSAITDSETEILFELVQSLKDSGVAIVYITHKLEELERIGDWVTILRDGRRVGSGRQRDYSRRTIINRMVGREIEEIPQKLSKVQKSTGHRLFKAEKISVRRLDLPDRFVVEGVSFSVARGEVLGIFGLMGAGRTVLLEAIFGLHHSAFEGSLFLSSDRVEISSPKDAIELGIALAPEDRKAEGLILKMNVAENTSLASLKDLENFLLLDKKIEKQRVQQIVDQLGIRTTSQMTPTINLSGGNQQKVVLAKWLATSPRLLMLDEPTRGIDVGAKREIYSLIEKLTKDGLAVILVSSELPEILRLSDRIMVMAEGRKTGEFSSLDTDQEEIMRAALHFRHSA